jgi:hypothetical protein
MRPTTSRASWPYIAASIAVVLSAATLVACGGGGGGEQIEGTAAAAAETASIAAGQQVTITTTSSLPAPGASGTAGEEPTLDVPIGSTPTDPTGTPVKAASFAATELKPFADASSATGTDLKLIQKTVVDKGHATSMASPSVAANGDRVLVTWNKPTKDDGTAVSSPGGGIAFSSDGGKTFAFADSETLFKEANKGFCCDQRVFYSKKYDLWIWVGLYYPDENGNVVRLAIADGNDGFDKREFWWWDFKPADYAAGPETAANYGRFDLPNVAASDEYAFLAANVYPKTGDVATGSVVLHIALKELKAHGTINYVYYRVERPADATDAGPYTSPGFVQGATSKMYWAYHATDSKLKLWAWADDAEGAVTYDVVHSQYKSGSASDPYSCPRTGGNDWCKGADDRMQTGWVGKSTIGFAWNAHQDKDNGFPYPFVMVVQIDETTLKVAGEPFIWSANQAYEYPALAANANGEAGGAALAGGGTTYPTCAAVVRDVSNKDAVWDARIVEASDNDFSTDQTGNYMGATPSAPDSKTWLGACMTQKGGTGDANVEVDLGAFGRTSDSG